MKSIPGTSASSETAAFNLSSILDSFTLVMGKLSPDSESAQDLIRTHQNLQPTTLATYLNQLSLLASLLQKFALSQVQFQSLAQEDQAVLLRHNIPLYLQYVTARYLNAKSGLEQLTWILEGNYFPDFAQDVEDLSVISFDEFVWEQVVFRSSEMFQMYSDYLQLIQHFFSFPHYFNALVANALLYQATETMKKELKDLQKIEGLHREAEKLAEKELNSAMSHNINLKLATLCFALSQMKTIFDLDQVFDEKKFPPAKVPRPFSISFTKTEEDWLIHKFERLQSQFSSIEPSKMMLKDAFQMLTGSEFFRLDMAQLWLSLNTERVKRVLKDHTEFQVLSSTDQNFLWSKNFRQSFIVTIIRVNVAKTGKEQFRNVLGIIDSKDRTWENRFNKLINLDALNPIFMHNIELKLGMLDQANFHYLGQLFSDVTDFCMNDETFQLLILLSLFDTDGLPTTPAFQSIFDIQNIYLKLFQRKFQAVQASHTDYSKFRVALNKVKILANLMDTYLLSRFY